MLNYKNCIILNLAHCFKNHTLIHPSPKICQETCWKGNIYQLITSKHQCLRLKALAAHVIPVTAALPSPLLPEYPQQFHSLVLYRSACQWAATLLRGGTFNKCQALVMALGRLPFWAPPLWPWRPTRAARTGELRCARRVAAAPAPPQHCQEYPQFSSHRAWHQKELYPLVFN